MERIASPVLTVLIVINLGCANELEQSDQKSSGGSLNTIRIEEALPELGEHIDRATEGHVLFSGSQSIPYVTIERSGHRYTVGLWCNRSVYVTSSEVGVASPEGITVGKTLLRGIEGAEVVHEPGFAYTVRLRSGWIAAWKELPSPNDPVEWLFLRGQFGETMHGVQQP